MQVLQQQRDWPAIVTQAGALPTGLTAAQRDPLVTLGVRAELALSDGGRARKMLRSLLWGKNPPPKVDLRTWRRLLIESYLVDGRLDDARLALLNYQLDYTPKSDAESAVLARVWLRVKEPSHALDLLSAKAAGSNTYWLYLLASLRSGSQPTKTLMQRAMKAASAKGLKAKQASRLWGVAVAAAMQERDWPTVIDSLEHYLALSPTVPLTPLLPFNGDTLWQAYHALAMASGNKGKLLIGDDADWEKAAKNAQKRGDPLLARAYNAILTQIGQTPQAKAMGYRWLGTSLLSLKDGKRLLDRLFLNAPKRFPAIGEIPVDIRLVLANDAVDRDDLGLAARLMAGLNKPPPGEDPYQWTLRLSRVLILGGRPKAGIGRLQQLIARQKAFDQTQADQLMQVLFDLQSIKLNTAAIGLFEALYPKLSKPQQKREVLFWEAQSYEALGDEAHAARLYMQSALLLATPGYGPWGSTARYNAALALSKAGMTADAKRVLSDLLAHTQDPLRRKVLQQKLAELERLPAQPPAGG